VPAFRELFRRSSGFADFFERVKALAKLDKTARNEQLDRLQDNVQPMHSAAK